MQWKITRSPIIQEPSARITEEKAATIHTANLYMVVATTSNRFVILYTDINRQQLVLPVSTWPNALNRYARKSHLATNVTSHPNIINIKAYHQNNKQQIYTFIESLPCFLYSSKFIFWCERTSFWRFYRLMLLISFDYDWIDRYYRSVLSLFETFGVQTSIHTRYWDCNVMITNECKKRKKKKTNERKIHKKNS